LLKEGQSYRRERPESLLTGDALTAKAEMAMKGIANLANMAMIMSG